MTQKEALIEAKRLWGESGTVRVRGTTGNQRVSGPGRLARYRYEVGNGGLGKSCTIVGMGNSWAEAFEDARPR